MGWIGPSGLSVTSPAFPDGGRIPKRHTVEGEDVSPELSWTGAPEGTRGFAVFCHDPDAPMVRAGTYGWVHWVLYDLPASVTRLEEGTALGTRGATDSGKAAYHGPAPPPGHGEHRYYFWVLALDRDLNLEPGLTLERFLEKAEPHVLAMNRLAGTYSR